MLLRALMLNPLPSLSGPVTATYFTPTLQGGLVDVVWDAAALSMTFRITTALASAGTTSFGVSGQQVVALPSAAGFGSKVERYTVAGTGLVRPFIDTYPKPASPVANTDLLAILADGSYVWKVSSGSATRPYYVSNAITGAVLGPYPNLDAAGVTDGDVWYAAAAVNGVSAAGTFAYQRDSLTGATWLGFTPIQNTEIDFAAVLGSGGRTTVPLTDIPFRWGNGTAIGVRAYTATIAGASPAWHSSGSVRLACTITTYEFYDDGLTGAFASGGRPIHAVRKSERKTLGWLVLSGGRARFVPRLVIGESWISAPAAQYGGVSNQWQIVRQAGSGGGWTSTNETVLEDTGWRTRLLTPDGIVASDANRTVIHADSTGATVLAPPAVVANVFERAFPVPGLGAIVVPTYVDGSATRFGQAYASFDGGVTWKGPLKTFKASPSFPTASQDNVADYALLPLYPS